MATLGFCTSVGKNCGQRAASPGFRGLPGLRREIRRLGCLFDNHIIGSDPDKRWPALQRKFRVRQCRERDRRPCSEP